MNLGSALCFEVLFSILYRQFFFFKGHSLFLSMRTLGCRLCCALERVFGAFDFDRDRSMHLLPQLQFLLPKSHSPFRWVSIMVVSQYFYSWSFFCKNCCAYTACWPLRVLPSEFWDICEVPPKLFNSPRTAFLS